MSTQPRRKPIEILLVEDNPGDVVSNDSDLTTPVEMAVNRLGKRVVTVNPYRARMQSSELRRGRVADYTRNQRFRAARVPVPAYAGQ